jgi:large subunit ribosomal protein L16
MLLPKKTKFRKYQRGRRRGFSKGQTTVQAGDYGLKALEAGWVTNRQIEAARIAMGSGKGAPEHWVAVVKPGRVMFELAGVDERLAKEALRLAGRKLPLRTRVVKREADLFAS